MWVDFKKLPAGKAAWGVDPWLPLRPYIGFSLVFLFKAALPFKGSPL